jgi:hypothetical protein
MFFIFPTKEPAVDMLRFVLQLVPLQRIVRLIEGAIVDIPLNKHVRRGVIALIDTKGGQCDLGGGIDQLIFVI